MLKMHYYYDSSKASMNQSMLESYLSFIPLSKPCVTLLSSIPFGFSFIPLLRSVQASPLAVGKRGASTIRD